jgi:hypothetical protein
MAVARKYRGNKFLDDATEHVGKRGEATGTFGTIRSIVVEHLPSPPLRYVLQAAPHAWHTTLQVVILHTTRPRKISRTPKRRAIVRDIHKSSEQPARARVRDTRTTSLSAGLLDHAALVKVPVGLDAVGDAEVTGVATSFCACTFGRTEVVALVLDVEVGWGLCIAVWNGWDARWQGCCACCNE